MSIISEKPILFNGAMVRAILAGRKTQTRRPMKRPPSADLLPGRVGLDSERMSEWVGETVTGEQWRSRCEVADIGGALWVRETWRAEELPTGQDGVRFAADDAFVRIANTCKAADRWGEAYENGKHGTNWRPSIFMPRWAARLILPVVDVRPQRLHDISEEDALAEGIERDGRWFLGSDHRVKGTPKVFNEARAAFADLWAAVYGRASWDANPWVWAVTFRRDG